MGAPRAPTFDAGLRRMIPASALSKLARLGLSDEQADAVAAMLREVEDATRAEPTIDNRTPRQQRNSRYYESKVAENRLNTSESKTPKTDQDDVKTPKTVENPPYKDNHASAPVCSNGSSLRSEPVIENKQEKLKPTVLSKISEVTEILAECLSAETAADLIAHRKAKKSPLGPRGARGLVKDFIAFGDPEACASAMMTQGWTGFKPGWMASQPRGSPEKPKNPWLKRMVEGELEHRAKINGNGHELGLHDLEILRNGQEPTMLDGLAFDARDDAAPRGK
jgi:hypothetical protein